MNGKLKELNEKVENIKEWKWLGFTFVVCLIAILSISVSIIWQPFIHAEDGTIFLKDALEHGKNSLFYTYGGYLGILPRAFAILAIHLGRRYNSFIVVTMVMKWCSIIFSIICVNYINSKDFKVIIKNRVARLLISILAIMVMSNHTYMLYNATCIHWWGGLLAFLVGLVFLNKKMPSFYIIPFLMLAILSSPSALLVAIPIIYYIISKLLTDKKIIKEEKFKYLLNHKADILKLLIIAIAGLIQVYSIAFVADEIETINNPDVSLVHIGLVIKQSIVGVCKNIPYILKSKMEFAWINNITMIITGMIIWIVLFFRSIKNKQFKIILWCFLEIFILYFMDIYKCYGHMILPSNSFYNSIPTFAGIFAIVKTICDDYTKFFIAIKYLVWGFLCAAIVIFYKYTSKPYYGYCKNIYSIEQYVNFESEKTVEVEIHPGGVWHVNVPT
jgi:hypothetical protein